MTVILSPTALKPPGFSTPTTPSLPQAEVLFQIPRQETGATQPPGTIPPPDAMMFQVDAPSSPLGKLTGVPHDETNMLLPRHLATTNPLLISGLRFLGYADEVFESLVGAVASMAAVANHSLKPLQKRLAETAPQAQQFVEHLDEDGAFHPYAERQTLTLGQTKTFQFFNRWAYGICNAYCGVDAARTGYRGAKITQQQTHDPAFAAARGAQLTVGHYLFQYFASYMVPAIIIKEIIYKNFKSMLTLPAMAARELTQKTDMTPGLRAQLARWTQCSNPIALVNAAHGPNSPRVMKLVDAGVSLGAAVASLGSMHTVAKYLDPMFERATEDVFYRPTNRILMRVFPEAYQRQMNALEKPPFTPIPIDAVNAHEPPKTLFEAGERHSTVAAASPSRSPLASRRHGGPTASGHTEVLEGFQTL
jgi:hypothetical protein